MGQHGRAYVTEKAAPAAKRAHAPPTNFCGQRPERRKRRPTTADACGFIGGGFRGLPRMGASAGCAAGGSAAGRAAAIGPPTGGCPREARAWGARRLDAKCAPSLPLRCLSAASPLGTAVEGLWQGYQFPPLIRKLSLRRTHPGAGDAIFPPVFASQ